MPWGSTSRGTVAAFCLVVLAACGNEGTQPTGVEAASDSALTESPAAQSPSSTESPSQSASATGVAGHSQPGPESLDGSLSGADLLVYSQDPITDEVRAQIDAVTGVSDSEPMSLAQVAVQDQILQIAAVDPASYWRFNPEASAQEEQVWSRVAGGELSIDQKLGEALQDGAGEVQLGNDQSAARIHIGAYAPQVPQIDGVVNSTWIDTLGMKQGNALLVATGTASPQSVQSEIQSIVGDDVSVQILGPDLDITVQQTAFLTGGSVAAAVGSFSYGVIGGGRITPDPAWVKANIRTEPVPILGQVTCHRVVLPQLRAALAEIKARGLADTIHPDEYAGCFYPRFIAGTNQLSLHSFGIALDLNVPGNQRGTVGEMDRTVVSIFKKWGFAWGGDWNYTDPMHFQMDRLVDPR